MIVVSGKARIQHAETGVIYEIDGDTIKFDSVASDERSMGTETQHTAIVEIPELGQLAWTIWEYPVGTENRRDTNIADHILLENIDYRLAEARVRELVDWFFENYENPANNVPYESKKGGYLWGPYGPHDAADVLYDNFSDEDEAIIPLAVDQIEQDGFDWAAVHIEDEFDEENLQNKASIEELTTELHELITHAPQSPSDPTFYFNDDDGLIHIALPPDQSKISNDDDLLDELISVTSNLLESLRGTNAHLLLSSEVEYYKASFSNGQLSISRLYARGIRLDNVAQSIKDSIKEGELQSLSLNTDTYLTSVLELHQTYIMSDEKGRKLAEASNQYHQPTEQTTEVKEVLEQTIIAIKENSILANEVKDQMSDILSNIGKGNQPKRSNQNAYTALISFSSAIGALIVAPGFSISIPGKMAIQLTADVFNAMWYFLPNILPLLDVLAGLNMNDYSFWLAQFSDLLKRIRDIRK